jgi:hypothetical protein
MKRPVKRAQYNPKTRRVRASTAARAIYRIGYDYPGIGDILDIQRVGPDEFDTTTTNPRKRRKVAPNPLVGWEDTSGLKPANIKPPYIPMVKAGAREKFEQVYNHVGLPIAVVLRPENWQGGWLESVGRDPTIAPEDAALAKKLNAILLVVKPPPRDPEWENEPRGEFFRVSAFTPFMLLHRLGDMLRYIKTPDPKYREAKRLLKEINAYERAYTRGNDTAEKVSRGVDTWAGRAGVLIDVEADLFAKWLLTGRVAYDPYNPPPRSEAEAAYRNIVAKNMPKVFSLYYQYLTENIPAVYYVG